VTAFREEKEDFIEPTVRPLANPSEENILLAVAQIEKLRVPPREFLHLYAENDFFQGAVNTVSNALKIVLNHYDDKRMLHPSAFSSTFLKKLLDQGSPRVFEAAFDGLQCFDLENYSDLCAEALRMVDQKPDDERYLFVASLCMWALAGVNGFPTEQVFTFARHVSLVALLDSFLKVSSGRCYGNVEFRL
jgi:hypothetical protein